MFPLFETIKIVDGIPHNLAYHQRRFEVSYFQIYNSAPKLKIEDKINIPPIFLAGKVKCRFCYNRLSFDFSFQHYVPKKIESLKLIHNNLIEYALKYTDRSKLGLLLKQKGDCDEVIIVKNGLITDTSYSNLVFFNGINWVTPSTPLLAGTMRAKLLKQGLIQEEDIPPEELTGYTKFKLINAMLDFEEQPLIDISVIKR